MLDKWKNKPEHVRERVAYTATLATLIVLVLFWVWTLNFRFSTDGSTAPTANAFHPFSLIKDSLTGIYSDVKNGISGTSTEFKNTSDTNSGSAVSSPYGALVPVYNGAPATSQTP